MTVYLTAVLSHIEARYGNLSGGELAGKLAQMGLLDPTLCKVLAVRQEVEALMRRGEKKVDAMWMATEKFSCTYEYVRKCVYYYNDVSLD